MRIQISDDEVYELKLPEKINNHKEFYKILKKFDNIAKIIKINLAMNTTFNKFKSDFQTTETSIATKRTYGKNLFFNTREKALDILQYGYHGDKEDKDRISKLMGFSWAEINKRFHNLTKRYSIQPNEIGLTQKPSQYLQYSDVRIPNYNFKVNTGVFDEK